MILDIYTLHNMK